MKFISADTIFTLAGPPIKNGVVVVENGKIEDVLSTSEIPDQSRIEKHAGVICPGFVNAHCHLELSHLFGTIDSGTGLKNFALQLMIQRNLLGLESRVEAMKVADEKMWENGIVAVGDISNVMESFSVKQNSKIFYHTFIELLALDVARKEMVFGFGSAMIENLKSLGLSGSLCAHAPYSVSLGLMMDIKTWNDQHNTSHTIHNQETREEDLFFQKKEGSFVELYQALGISIDHFKASGKSSVQTYLSSLFGKTNLLLVHNTFTREEDLLWLKNNYPEIWFCFCAKANQYIENELPPIHKISSQFKNNTIGTDSLASNNSLSILEEMKAIQHAEKDILLSDLITWGCLNGARFLGIENWAGSIEKGKMPGINLITEIKEGKLTNESEVKKLI